MRPRPRRASAFAAALVFLLLASVAQADEAPGNDSVLLKSGGWIRGTVVAVEPGVGVKLIELGAREVRFLPWADVAGVERDKFAPASPVPSAPPAPPPAVAPAAPAVIILSPAPVTTPGSIGTVRLHVTSPTRATILSHGGYLGPRSVNGVVKEGSPIVCIAPCETEVDLMPNEVFRIAGPDVTESRKFRLDGLGHDVDLAISPGNEMNHLIAVGALKGGGVPLLLGALTIAGGAATSTHDGGTAFIAVGAAVAGVGALMLIGGGIALARTRTTFELHPSGATIANRPTAVQPRYWAGEF